ncbi:MAG: isoleucine-tRNA ligase [Icmadophila ericetorum]|nr:isoleucine-tRNA ligase [Icmadophila ericetorum]
MPSPTRILKAVSWSSTLCLPKSTFPARVSLAEQQTYLKKCTDDLYAYAKSRDPSSCTGQFILHDGPPYANGSLHVGHALNKILKDITCRYQLSIGKYVDYVPGWDCHGLPIELKALQRQKELGTIKEDGQLGAAAIRKVARELATSTVEEQKNGFRKWGIMANWDGAWTTMDKGFELKQLEVFRQMLAKGLIYRKFKPVYWSPSSRTALAEAELEYKEDHISKAAFVKFPLLDVPSAAAQRSGLDWSKVSAVVWTTTPWTLPANKAIAVHSDLDYAIVESQTHGVLIIAESRLSETRKLCKEEFASTNYAGINGADLVGAAYRNPVFGHTSSSSKILHADFVKADSGSGLVHIAPGHGMDDYKLCQDLSIDVFAPVDNHGEFTNEAMPNNPEILLGKPVLTTGNLAVLELLTSQNALLASHKYKHKYPYDWRSKQPLILRATEQWFADVGEIRESALKSLDKVRFIPEGGKERLSSFVRNRMEWCISRQRAWGVPIPALYHKDTGSAVLDNESVSHIISVIQDRGVDAWWIDDETDPVWTPPSLRELSGQSLYRRGKDTMDVWFDSGTSWTQIAKQPESFESPIADVYLEGSDQHRGWFQSSLLTKIAHQSTVNGNGSAIVAPYKTLITHGFTLDSTGRKMSKSEGNIISPDEIMNGTMLPPMKRKGKGQAKTGNLPLYDAMGPDALRLWAAGCDYTKDVVVSQTVLQVVQSSLAKLRVTFKMLVGLLEHFDLNQSIQFSHYGWIDQLALVQLRELDQDCRKYYDEFEYHKVVAAANQYVNANFSSFYMESIKDRMYAEARDSPQRRQAQMVLSEIYKRLACVLAPIAPLLVEEAQYHLGTKLTCPLWHTWSVQDLSTSSKDWVNPQLEIDMVHLFSANAAVKRAQELARGDKRMGSSLQSYVYLQIVGLRDGRPTTLEQLFKRYLAELGDFFVVSGIAVDSKTPPTAIESAAWHYTAGFEADGDSGIAHVYSPSQAKCERCWRYMVPKDSNLEANLCLRCVEVIKGIEEQRPDPVDGRPNLVAVATDSDSQQTKGL